MTVTPALREQPRDRRDAALDKCELALAEAALQLDYLHEKFRITGSGNAVLARIRAVLSDIAELRHER